MQEVGCEIRMCAELSVSGSELPADSQSETVSEIVQLEH